MFENGQEIIQIIIIPDLDNQEVATRIADWASHAQPALICGLLAAAKQRGDDSWQSMMQILQPKLAHRWAAENLMATLWDPHLVMQPSTDSGRSRHGFFGRK